MKNSDLSYKSLGDLVLEGGGGFDNQNVPLCFGNSFSYSKQNK